VNVATRFAPGFTRLLATTGALALALVPHLAHLRPWVPALFAGAVALRLLVEHRGWALPPRWLRLGAALVATLAVLVGYRTLNGLEAGTALLTVMAALKLSETRAPRDHAVLVFIGYFLGLAALLYEQSFARLAYVLLACWALTAALARVHRPVEANTAVRPFRLAARVLLLGLPLAVVLFLFVPRIEGRFWAVPTLEPQGRTGIDEEMSPGDLSSLGLSDEPAFRAWFTDRFPPGEQRYWRMLVLEDFDGRTWRRVRMPEAGAPVLETRGSPVEYRIALEPTGKSWLPALDYVERWPEAVAWRGRALQLIHVDRTRFEPRPVTQRLEYALRSYPASLVTPDRLALTTRARNLRLPEDRHPRARALAAELRSASADERDYVRRVLQRFATGDYAYTLEPPRLGADPVDEFLFDTREGFCEHYASSFTVLMRAAGIPARVVTGYQGGEANAYGGYLLVRQSSAHAWSEVWLPGEGWTRVDPTAAVAPERVRRGLLDAETVRGDVPGEIYAQFQWLGDARAAWDALRTAWYRNVVGYGERAQADLLERLGLGERGWQGLALALTAGFLLAALALAGWLGWEFRPRRRDPVDAAWADVCARLADRGHPRAAHEGPLDYAKRVARAEPTLAPVLQDLVDAYVGARYLPGPGPAERERFVGLARRFVRQPRSGR
jgi:transglutaminase-like putative cysteine protease